MSDKLVKSLEKSKTQRTGGDEKFLTDVKLLMDSNAQAEIDVLKTIGISREIDIAENAMERKILNETFSKKYKDNIFHISDIEALALKYKLYLRQANQFRGKIPADLGAIILNFKKEHLLHIDQSNNSDKGKFFVLAPPSMFLSYNTPKIKWQEFVDVEKERLKSLSRSLEDPMVFYQIDKEHFKLLKAWGSDFTLWRRFLGLISKTTSRVFVFSLMMLSFLTYFTVKATDFLFNYAQILINEGNKFLSLLSGGIGILMILAGVCIFVFSIISYLCNENRKYSIHNLSTKYMWNKNIDF